MEIDGGKKGINVIIAHVNQLLWCMEAWRFMVDGKVSIHHSLKVIMKDA